MEVNRTMPIDIENLNLEELLQLNKRIVHRIQYLSRLKTRSQLDKFEVGDQVTFQSNGRMAQGVIVRVNQKSLSVRTQNSYWNIHPNFVTKVASSKEFFENGMADFHNDKKTEQITDG
jgi:putative ribosome biogenesis GTPase RsgA